MSLFRNRRKQQEPPSSFNFGSTRRREPVDPPCTLEREESPPDIHLTEHQLELLKGKSRSSDEPSDHGAPVLYDDENVIVVDENVAASKDKEPVEEKQVDGGKKSTYSRPLARAANLKQRTLASDPTETNATSAQQSSSKMTQRPFTTRSNQQSTSKTTAPAPARTSSKNLALASLMSRKTSRGSVFSKNVKNSSNDNSEPSSSSDTKAANHNTTSHHMKSSSTASNGTAASEQDKALLRKMLGGTGTEKPSLSSKTAEKGRQHPAPASSTSSNSMDKHEASASKDFDQKEFLRGYMMSSHRPSAKPSATTSIKADRGTGIVTSHKVESKQAATSKESPSEASQGSDKQQSAMISRKNSAETTSAVSSNNHGNSSSSGFKSASSSSSGQSAVLRRVLQKTLSKASGKNNSTAKRTLTPRGKLSPRGKPKGSSGSPRSDAQSSSTSENPSDNKSERESRLESAAVSLSRKVLQANPKTRSPKGQASLNFKGYLRNKMGRSKAPVTTLSRSNPVTDHIDTNLSKSFSADTADISKEASAKSVDETVDETLDSTVESSRNRSQKQIKTTRSTDETSGAALATSSTLSDDSNGSESYGPIPSSTSNFDQGGSLIDTMGTSDTEESSTIMANLQSISTDSMQYSVEESCDGAERLGKAAIPELRIAPTQSRLQSICYNEPEGYTEFLQALRLEASGAHSQLWSSFQAVMSGSARKVPPKQDRSSSFRFDLATRSMLGDMNNYLKKQALVECVTATQLVSDNRFAQEAAVGLALRASTGSTKISAYVQAKQQQTKYSSGVDSSASASAASGRGRMNSNLPTLRHMEALVDGDENTPTHGTQSTSKHGSVEIAESSSSVENTLGNSKSEASSEQESPLSEATTSEATVKSHGALKTTNAVRAAHGKISKGSKQIQQPSSVLPENESAVPWKGVRLRAVAAPDMTPADVGKASSQPPEPTMPSPWAKVKLRPVSAAEESGCNNMEQTREQSEVCVVGSDANDVGKAPELNKDDEPEIIICPTNLTDLEDKADIRPCEPVSSEPEIIYCPSHLSDVQKKTTTEASVTSEPSDSTREKIDESAVVFSLRQSLNTPAEAQEKVVIGKKMVMYLRPQPGEPTDRALVIWKYPRDGIKALKLDMESQSVNLSLSDGELQTLTFDDSTDCLKFANAFYELLTPNEAESIARSDSTDSSQHMETLSYEEQRVLETYRQARRTKPANDAMRSIVPESSPILNDEETKIAESYRKMLKDSIPLNDVRARMQLDGVSVAVENFVLSSVKQAEETASKDSMEDSQTQLPLSEEDKKVAETYKKMLRLRVPPEAVQHKMTKEGVDPKIMGFVLGQAGVLATDTNYPEDLSESERKVAALYSNMLKLMVPSDSVRSRMKEDNIDERIVFAVLGQDKVEKNTLEQTATKLTEAEEAIAASYRKMLKLMIPKEAVRHKMIKDQVDPKIMVVVVGGEEPKETEKIQLTEKEEEIAATYRKMLKLQLPKEAVLHRMEKEGVSERIKKAVVGSNASTSATGTNSNVKKNGTNNKGGSKLVSLHWTPLSGEELNNSVWRASKKRKVTKAQPEGSDISKLVELFQKKNIAKTVKGKGPDSGNAGTGKAKLLDINRANNIAISLKAFKDFSYDELAEILRNIDPYGKLSGERVQFVRDLLPTAAEINVIRRYYGSPDRLVPAEIWFQKIAHVKRLDSKAHVLHTMEVFDVEVAEIRENLQLLAQVCNQVMESERLRELLDMVLQIGNIMNEGTRTGGAAGFKFDSLLRLTQTKSADGKTTVLDYMVTIFAAKDQREVLNLMEDFPECQAASRVLITDLVANVRNIGDTLQKCKKEFELLSSEATGKVNSTAGNFQRKAGGVSQDTASDTKMQLLSAIKSRGIDDPRKASSEAPHRNSVGFMKKNDILDAIKSKGASKSEEAPAMKDLLKAVGTATESTETQRESPRKSLVALQHGHVQDRTGTASREDSNLETAQPSMLQQGMKRLGNFIKEAEKNYEVLKSDCDTALATCQEMSKYCGESGGERATDTLLGILYEFASNLEAAVKKHDRAVAVESRKQKKQAEPTPNNKQRRRPEDYSINSSPNSKKDNGDTRKSSKQSRASPKRKPSPECPSKPLLPSAPTGKNTKSLVLMVNQLLKGADEKTKADFSQGVVYEDADSTLKEIYEREKKAIGKAGIPPLPSGRRSVESDILTTIKKRQGETDADVARETRSQLERVIGNMNCTGSCTASIGGSDADSVKTESSQLENSFRDLQSRWSQYKGEDTVPSTSSVTIASSKQSDQNQDDEGSVHLPIDCTGEFENDASSDQMQTGPNVLNTIVAFEKNVSGKEENKDIGTISSQNEEQRSAVNSAVEDSAEKDVKSE